jgi:hypothetical protein
MERLLTTKDTKNHEGKPEEFSLLIPQVVAQFGTRFNQGTAVRYCGKTLIWLSNRFCMRLTRQSEALTAAEEWRLQRRVNRVLPGTRACKAPSSTAWHAASESALYKRSFVGVLG